jgi:site-specific recombinase XerD
LAYEAADTGLLRPDLAAGIRRVKGAKKIGVRLGNWLTAEQSGSLLRAAKVDSLKGRRDRAILALLLGCGLRRGEVTHLRLDHLQQREEHWACGFGGQSCPHPHRPGTRLGQGRD